MIRFFFAFLLTCAFFVHSSDDVIYVNGILNTKTMALESAIKVGDVLKKSDNHSENKRSFKIFYIWNPTGWVGSPSSDSPSYSDGLADVKELFLLKSSEEHYIDDIVKIVSPFNQSRILDKSIANSVATHFYDLTPGNNQIEDDMPSIDEYMQGTQKVLNSIVNAVNRRERSIVVAHSQGNLLANLAYAKVVSDLGNDIYKKMRVINVANVSNVSVSGLNFTHAGDAALYASAAESKPANLSLETMATRLEWYRETPSCVPLLKYCLFSVAPPTFDTPEKPIPDQPFKDQLLDHGFVDTYLSKAIVDVRDSQGISFTTGANRMVDRFEDFVYAAAESLDFSNAGIEVISVSPLVVTVGEETVFTVEGKNLSSGMGFAVNDCSPSSVEVAGGTSTKRQFKCTMGQSVGEKNGVVKNRPSGITAFEFKVQVLLSQVGTWESSLTADSITATNIFYKNLSALPNGRTVFSGKHSIKYGVSCDLGQDLEITIDRNEKSFGITTVTKSDRTECQEGNVRVYTAGLGAITIRSGQLENGIIILHPWNGCDSTINNVCYSYDSIKPK